VSKRFCVDTSAWHRADYPLVAAEWGAKLDADLVSICDQVRLEILYSAQNSQSYEALLLELSALRLLPTGVSVLLRAIEVQRQLAHVGGLHHRSVKIADLIVAASAEAAGDIVWHYDSDFDRIAAITGQPTEWIAPRGSL
jgi:predicted nucleic acid-binding protein